MGRDKTRTVLYTVAGLYLVYLAYGLSQDLGTVAGGEKLLIGAFMVTFVVAGVGLVIWGVRKGMAQAQEAGEETQEEKVQEAREETQEERVQEAGEEEEIGKEVKEVSSGEDEKEV